LPAACVGITVSLPGRGKGSLADLIREDQMETASLSVRTRLIAAAIVSLGLVAGLVAYSATPANGAPTATEAGKKGKKKKKKKKKKAPAPATPIATPVIPTPPAPTPLPLTAAEVIQRVTDRAAVYCAEDELCLDSGYYFDGAESNPDCVSRSTYTWTCYGYNDEDFEPDGAPDGMVDGTCDFREIVSRSGISGVTSQLDLTFGDEGFDCYLN
jgi:hypothetical protein